MSVRRACRARPTLLLSVLVLAGCAEEAVSGAGGFLDPGTGRTVRDQGVVDAADPNVRPPEADAQPGAEDDGEPPAEDPDGEPDEGPPAGEPDTGPTGDCADGEERPCPAGCGMQRCVEGAWSICEQAASERCNNADDDCDGRIDETFPGLGIGCTQRVNGCMAEGINVCNAAGNGVECRVAEVAPAPEICDGIDNDCDGTVDEDFPGQRCCTEAIHCPPGVQCVGGLCEGGPPVGNGGACDAPTLMPGFGAYRGDTSGREPLDSGSCGALIDLGPEAVFQFTLQEAARVRLDTLGSFFDTVLYVRTDCADPRSEVACDDDGGDLFDSAIELDARAGVTYYVFVDGTGLAGEGPFVLNFGPGGVGRPCLDGFDCRLFEDCINGQCVEVECFDDFDCPIALDCVNGECVEPPPPPMPVGGTCGEPTELAAFGRHQGRTTGRQNAHGTSCQANATGPEQVFVFTLDAPHRVTLDTAGSSFDTVLSVRTACGDQGAEVACNDDVPGVGTTSRVRFIAAADTPYYVIVDGYSGRSGDVVLDFSGEALPPACVVDEPATCPDGACVGEWCFAEPAGNCAGAQLIQGPGVYRADTAGAPNRLGPGCANSTSGEAVFALAVPETLNVRLDTQGTGFDTILYVLEGCGREIACDDDGGPALTSVVNFRAEAGVLYFVVVDGFRDAAGPVVLNVARQ